ncbi:hypothetical protein ACOPJQ_01335 [Luteimonas dalianensis]|uniref:hypothetical protein n=1 Tax=Luteimonas dalianensis TaxID=1148196 RepID=UPI003BF26617
MRPWKQPLSALLVGLLFGLAGCAGESGTAAAPVTGAAQPSSGAARQWRFESGAPDRSITRVLEFSVPSAGG